MDLNYKLSRVSLVFTLLNDKWNTNMESYKHSFIQMLEGITKNYVKIP